MRLDQCLRNYGPESDATRELLRRYTAAVIASTWPNETMSTGDYTPTTASPVSSRGMESPKLGELLNRIGITINELEPRDTFHQQVATNCRLRFQALVQARWLIIEQAHPTISRPFYLVLTFWLAVVFACFGLSAPHGTFVIAVMALCAVSITSAVYVILDMDTPFTGLLVISSQPMRNALADISR